MIGSIPFSSTFFSRVLCFYDVISDPNVVFAVSMTQNLNVEDTTSPSLFLTFFDNLVTNHQ